MSRRRIAGILALFAIVLAVTALSGWRWRQATERARQLAQAEKTLEDGDLVRAEELIGSMLKKDPRQLQPRLLQCRLCRLLGRWDEAERALNQALDLGLAEDQGRREYVLLEGRRQFARAELWLRQLQEQDPDDSEVVQTLVEGYSQKRRWTEAERSYSRWLELQPESTAALLGRGQVRQEMRRFELAADDLRKVIERQPENFRARLLLAHCLLSDARIREAEPELQICRQLGPLRPEPLIGLAGCAMEREDWDQAQALLNQALAFDPKSLAALHQQGNLFLLRRQYDRAIPVFERVVQINPRDPEGHLKLAQALRQQGDEPRAKEHARRYQELEKKP
jgi:tetratricopeptide (TPR) repeat protein